VNIKVISAAFGFVLMVMSHSPVTVAVGGVTLHVPVPLIAAGAVFAACAVATVILVRVLHRVASCPHLRTVST
jgi:hypothetical protein